MSIPPPVLSIDHTLHRGDHGSLVRVAQEWLCLALANPYPARVDDRPLSCDIDGDFGPQTEAAVRRFQRGLGWLDTGEIDRDLFARLVLPMRTALDTPLARDTLAETVVAVAEIHLKQQPRECGGDNKGPWPRWACKGAEGLPWCAGWASSVVEQAAAVMRVPNPVPHELSCTIIARDAKSRLIRGARGARPGNLFLVPAPAGNREGKTHHHAGIVVGVDGGHCFTIEANTNDGGSREGYGVFARRRLASSLDFVSVTPLLAVPQVSE